MKNIVLVIQLLLFYNHLSAQNTEQDFLNDLANASNTSVDFTYSFNQPEKYEFDSSITLMGKTKINLNFNSSQPNNVSISNKAFQGFKDITFSLEKSTSIILANCRFINCGTVCFEFGKEKDLYSNSQTSVTIKNCEFTDTDLKNDNSDYSYQLYFKKEQAVGKEICLMKNVKILECNFYLNDTANSFLTKNNLLPSRYSIIFIRDDNNVSISDITVNNNRIEITSPFYRAFGIVFMNDGNSTFRSPDISIEDQFKENNNLKIQNNYLKTVSNDPGHGIFIQGPYENVRVTDNVVIGFGANFLNPYNQLERDGSIHLYGGRGITRYSNDFQYVDVSYNKVSSKGTGIRLSGVYNAVVNYNEISILPDPDFYKVGLENDNRLKVKLDQAGINCRTGNFEVPKRQSRNVIIEHNMIQCDGVDRCAGIDIDAVKSFTVKNNQIYNPNNYGIIYHSNKGFAEQEFGNSIIENNLIDFGNQNVSSLKSNWYINYGMKYSGINISRDFNEHQKKIDFESLKISNNTIQMDQNSRIDPIRIEKIGAIEGIVKTKSYSIENNFLQTQQGLEDIPKINID